MRSIHRALFAGWLIACARLRTPLPAPGQPPDVAPAVLQWQVGIDTPTPGPLVETVLPATYHGRPVWRIVHRDLDPTSEDAASSYDLYDVDRASHEAVRSVSNQSGLFLALAFDGVRVHVDRRDGHGSTTADLEVAHALPEGPGTVVVLATLPLSPGYRTTYTIVDRWSEPIRPVEVTLVVGTRTRVTTRLGTCDVLDVTTAPADGSFRVHDLVLAEPPRFAIRTEYTRGDLHATSEVVEIGLDGPLTSCTRARSEP